MMRPALLAIVAILLLVMERTVAAEELANRSVDRSPVDLVLLPEAKRLVAINQGSGTASLVDLESDRVLHEVAVGPYPTAIIADRQGERLIVSTRDDGLVRIFHLEKDRLTSAGEIYLGYHPHGLALSSDETLLYVALAAADKVAVVELGNREVAATYATGRWPRWLALSSDGKRLAVTSSGDRGMSVIDCERGELLYQTAFAGLNLGHVAIPTGDKYAYFPWMVYRANPITSGNIKLGWVLASRIGRVSLLEERRREAFSLDPQGKAIADVHGLAFTPDEQRLVVGAAGTHELLVYRHEGLPFKDYGGTDHIEPELLADSDRFYRIELGGRPLGLRTAPDNRTVYVANYLRNSIQVVDIDHRQVAREISLGPAPEPSLARQGAVIFYDAKRSLDQWYSCHTCHYEGGVSGERMDTLNDGTRNTFKTVPALHNFDKTGPWTWHGWQKDPRAAMRKSLTETMLGPPPDGEDISALLAFLNELSPPPNPYRQRDGSLPPAAQRGKEVFHSAKAGCASCHSGPHYTDGQIHDVGLGSRQDAYEGFNTPSLVNVYERVKLLHDGRANSLEEVLAGPHDPAEVTGAGALTDAELRDLIEYLKTL